MDNKNITKTINPYDPPGGILIWILVFLELITFGIALMVLGIKAQHDPELFHKSRMMLHTEYGATNTFFLLISGYFMARAIHLLKKQEYGLSRKNVLIALAGGLLFLILKSIEYSEKIQAGLTIGYNDFFTFYWLLTLFHVIHVLVGMTILLVLSFNIKYKKEKINLDDAEASATFWHMCDLIWLLLFPVLYLLF
jgi:nitric oxide reductase NorE protein